VTELSHKYVIEMRSPREATDRSNSGVAEEKGIFLMLRARSMLAALAAALTVLGLVVALPATASGTAAAAAQTLTWTANDSITAYASVPSTAVAGATTIVFENSEATGNTTGMTHTLTFDTSTPGYNHDVSLNITASPFDSSGGRHQQDVTLTAGKYRVFCAIPGPQMVGELQLAGGGGAAPEPAATTAAGGSVTGGVSGAGLSTLFDAASSAVFAASSDFCASLPRTSGVATTGPGERPPSMKIASAATAASATIPATA